MTHGDYAEENNAEVHGPEDHGQTLDHPSQDSRPQGGRDEEEDDVPAQEHRWPEEDDRSSQHSTQEDDSQEVHGQALGTAAPIDKAPARRKRRGPYSCQRGARPLHVWTPLLTRARVCQ